MSDLLINHFATTRPDAIATHLVAYNTRDIETFLSDLDGGTASRVQARLPSRVMFELLESQPPTRIAQLLLAATGGDASSLIAHIPATRYHDVIAAASDSEQRTLRRLLGVAGQTVGMQTTNRFLKVSLNQTCAEVRRQLISKGMMEDGILVATHDDSTYAGVVPLTRVLADANADETVAQVLEVIEPIFGEASVDSVVGLTDWMRFPVLPVVDTERHFVGTVAIRDLRQRPVHVEDARDGHPLFQLLNAYMNICAQMLELLLSARGARK